MVQQRLQSLIETPGVIQYEHRVRSAKGEIRWQQWVDRAITDSRGRVVEFQAVGRDITECKRAEQAKARSQRLLLALSQAAQAVQRARTPEAVYQAIGEQICVLGLDVTVFNLSEDRTHLVVAYLPLKSDVLRTAKKLTGLSEKDYRFPLTPGGYYQRIISGGKTVISAQNTGPFAEALPEPIRSLAGRLVDLFGWQQSIIAPLTINSEVQGLLTVSGAELAEADMPAITAFANQAAIAIENARLYQETRRLAAFNEDIVQNIADGIVVQDAEGVFTFVNPAAAALLGYTPGELMGEPWTTIIPSDQRPIVQRDGARLMRGELDRCELEFVCKDGQRITVLVSGSPRRDAEGHVVGTMAVFTDITARKRAEEALKFQALVLDAVQNSVVVSDPEGNIVYVNAEALRNQKREREELVGQSVEVYGEDPSRGATQQQIRERTLENGEWHGEVVNYASDGTETVVDLRTALIRDDQGNPWRIVGIGTDITARKRMEEALRESEGKYRALFEEALNPIMVVDEEGRYIDANQAALAFLECDREALLRKHVWDFSPPALLAQQQQEHAPFVHRRTLETDYLVQGRIKTLLLNVVPVELRGRTILYGIGQDVTERKREEDVKTAQLRLIAHAAEHTVRELLQQFLDEAEALTGSEIGFYHFVEDDQRTLTLQAWSTNTLANAICAVEDSGRHSPISEAGVWVDVVHERRPVIHNDYASLPHKKDLPEGHVPVIRELVVPVFRGEKIVAILGVGNKHTDYETYDVEIVQQLADLAWETIARRRAEEALRESEAQYRFLAEHVTDVITRHAADGTYLYVSPSCKRLFGFDPEALIGAQPLEFLHPDDVDRFVKDYQEQVAKRDIVRFEYRRRRKDGTYLWVENTSRILRDPQTGDIKEVVGVLRDITARKQVEEVLLAQAEALQRTNAELQQLAYAISHDVAAPLRMIKYGIKKVHQDCQDMLDAADDQMLSYVAEEAEWMQRLIDDLREYSRVSTRGQSFAPTDCAEVLERVLRQLSLEVERTDALVTHDPLPTVVADVTQMVQLFQNLISNALKYHGEEPPRVHVAVEEAEDAWTFAVRDQGIGLDPRHAVRIFEIFERLHTREEYDGTGVGLAVCRRIVQRHGGRIWVESEVGEGATFYFTLPKSPGVAPSS